MSAKRYDPLFCRCGPGPRLEDNADKQLEYLRDWIARRVREDLADPVRVDPRHRHRITAMRGVEVRLNRRRRQILVRGRCGPHPDDWMYGCLKLDRPLSGPDWAKAWWWCVRESAPPVLRPQGDARLADELPLWINQAVRRSGLLLSARRQLRAALRLNPRLLSCARAMAHDGIATSEHYVAVWQSAPAARRRMRESPLLWPLYGAFGYPATCDLDAIKRCLRRYGLSQGGWRMLCRHGRALWWPLRRCHEFQRNPRREIAALANLVAAIGPALPPPSLVCALGRLSSMNRFDAADARRLMLPFRAAWRHLESLPIDARSAFAHVDADAVFTEWLLQSEPPRVSRGAEWSWFERWTAHASRASTDCRVRWPAFGQRRRIGGLEVVPLRDLRAVREAGLALRNCMGRAERTDRKRGVAMFLIRDGNDRAVAMFSARSGTTAFELLELRGRHNRNVDASVWSVARAYLALGERSKGCS